MHWIIRLGLSIVFFGAIVYADRRERRLLLFLLFGAVLALWVFSLLGLFGLPPASSVSLQAWWGSAWALSFAVWPVGKERERMGQTFRD